MHTQLDVAVSHSIACTLTYSSIFHQLSLQLDGFHDGHRVSHVLAFVMQGIHDQHLEDAGTCNQRIEFQIGGAHGWFNIQCIITVVDPFVEIAVAEAAADGGRQARVVLTEAGDLDRADGTAEFCRDRQLEAHHGVAAALGGEGLRVGTRARVVLVTHIPEEGIAARVGLELGHLQAVHIDADRDDAGDAVLGHLQRVLPAVHHQHVVLGGRVVDVGDVQRRARAVLAPYHTFLVAHIKVGTYGVHVLRAVQVHRRGVHYGLAAGVQAAQTRVHIVGVCPGAVVAKDALERIARHVDGQLVGGTRQVGNQLHIVEAVGVVVGTGNTVERNVTCHMTQVITSFSFTVTHDTTDEGRVITKNVTHIITIFQNIIAVTSNTTHSGHLA